MATSVTDAAFEGFRLTRDRPMALVGWAIFSIVAWIPLMIVLFLAVGPVFLAQIAQAASGAETTAPNFETMFGAVWAAIGIMLVGFILINSIQTAAIYRSVLTPGQKAWAYLRLGADEVRLVVLTIVMFLLGALVFGGAVILLSLGAAAAGDAGGILIWVVGGLALLGFWVFIAVRLSLAAAMTFAEGRLNLFGSWGLTRGIFWPMFGMYLLVVVFSFGVSLAGSFLGQLFAGMGMQTVMQTWAANPDQASGALAAGVSMPLLVVSIVGYLVIALISNVIQLAVTYAPQAAVYRHLTGPAVETTSEVFS